MRKPAPQRKRVGNEADPEGFRQPDRLHHVYLNVPATVARRPLAHVLGHRDGKVFSKVAGTIARTMEMKVGEPISARDPEGVGKRRPASPRAGRSETDTGTALEGVEPGEDGAGSRVMAWIQTIASA